MRIDHRAELPLGGGAFATHHTRWSPYGGKIPRETIAIKNQLWGGYDQIGYSWYVLTEIGLVPDCEENYSMIVHEEIIYGGN